MSKIDKPWESWINMTLKEGRVATTGDEKGGMEAGVSRAENELGGDAGEGVFQQGGQPGPAAEAESRNAGCLE